MKRTNERGLCTHFLTPLAQTCRTSNVCARAYFHVILCIDVYESRSNWRHIHLRHSRCISLSSPEHRPSIVNAEARGESQFSCTSQCMLVVFGFCVVVVVDNIAADSVVTNAVVIAGALSCYRSPHDMLKQRTHKTKSIQAGHTQIHRLFPYTQSVCWIIVIRVFSFTCFFYVSMVCVCSLRDKKAYFAMLTNGICPTQTKTYTIFKHFKHCQHSF